MFSVFIEIPRQFLLQQFCHIIAEALYLVLLMGVVPDGFLSGAEQELVAVRFFPELAQHAIPLSGMVKLNVPESSTITPVDTLMPAVSRKNSRTWDGSVKSSTLS